MLLRCPPPPPPTPLARPPLTRDAPRGALTAGEYDTGSGRPLAFTGVAAALGPARRDGVARVADADAREEVASGCGASTNPVAAAAAAAGLTSGDAARAGLRSGSDVLAVCGGFRVDTVARGVASLGVMPVMRAGVAGCRSDLEGDGTGGGDGDGGAGGG